MNPYKKEGYVYLAKSDTGHYKIGRSKNPWGRIKHFDTIMPVKVEIIHLIWCDNMIDCEKRLHAIFRGNRGNGEWFNLSDEDVDWIKWQCAYSDGDLHMEDRSKFPHNVMARLPY